MIDNQSILRLAPRTCRHSKADLCARLIAKSALDSCAGTISGGSLGCSLAEQTELTPNRLLSPVRRNCSCEAMWQRET